MRMIKTASIAAGELAMPPTTAATTAPITSGTQLAQSGCSRTGYLLAEPKPDDTAMPDVELELHDLTRARREGRYAGRSIVKPSGPQMIIAERIAARGARICPSSESGGLIQPTCTAISYDAQAPMVNTSL